MTGMRWIARLAVMGCLLGLLTGCGRGSARERQLELRAKGMEAAASGDYEAAVDAYEEALGLADMLAGSLELDIAAYKASALYRAGKTAEAIDTCTAILELKESAELYLTRGLIYRDTEDPSSANKDFAKAMELASRKDFILLGRLSYYMGDYTSAKSYLEEAVQAKDPEGIYWQAKLYEDMGNQDYAVSLYQSYLSQDQVRHADAYEKTAAWQAAQGSYDEALATLEAGIAMGDSASLPSLLSAEIAVYEQKADWKTARAKLESYLEQYPEDEKAQREYRFLSTR